MASTDLYVVMKDPAQISGYSLFEFGGARAAGVGGFYKTILQWLKCFLTAKGSDIGDATYGTNFAARFGSLNDNEFEIRDLVHEAVLDSTDTIRTYQLEADSLSPSEQLLSVELTGLKMAPAAVDIYILLKNAAGQNLTLSLPVGLRAPLPSP